MAEPARTTPLNPEYQHFVPQFILRNFAHKYTGPQRSKKGKNKKKDDNIFRGELVVNNVNLRVEPIVIEETKVKRILGQYDMYQDTALPVVQQRQIETLLGKLEAHVSTIFRKMTKAFEAGDPSVWVTREERNSIRKFLFILKYRGSTFHRRFYHETSDQYDANDKSRLRKYMEENSLKRPVDVWFHNLKTIINLNMNTENWKQELLEKMYGDDAQWFIMHSEMMYMAICTPSEAGGEFILTDNSYNVFEGPNTFVQNPTTGEFADDGWTSFHEFAPLSPKLMIILRSLLLPIPEEDSNPEIKAWREARRKEAVDDWYGASQQSSLADLPIKKARNTYSEIVNGRVQLLPGEDGAKRKTDKFCFQFFPVGVEHVNKINHILFDNAYKCTNIVFNSRDTFLKTLEWYMTYSGPFGKLVMRDFDDERRKLLENLAALMKSLGSTREAVWTESPGHVMSDFDKMNSLHRSLKRGLADWMLSANKELQTSPKPPRGPKFAYLFLGGSDITFLEDLDHATRMLKRRIKIDVRSQGMPEIIRNQNREQLTDEYLTYPSRMVLLYVKKVRLMVLGHNDEGYLQRVRNSGLPPPEEPEDIIAQALHDKMTTKKLNRLMYKTAMNDIDRAKDPISEQDLWKTPTQSLEGALRLGMIGKYVFGIPGIPEVERLASLQEQIIRRQDLNGIQGLPYHFIPNDQKMELLTRLMVKLMFHEALADSVEADLLPTLEDVLFKISYPTPPMKPPI
ncbi:hypothetical protein E0Z10_g6641 [Xylaria hypoxylon]|uniref:DUF4238 domain-containing protein n=1 Tax=Xylaria hypoxylon TaxID=37992 RepID=A0A4Z0YQ17_9PEZI|nr:hypothetical protein E0Z10_g6641 [Xylaria hypoxylon]